MRLSQRITQISSAVCLLVCLVSACSAPPARPVSHASSPLLGSYSLTPFPRSQPSDQLTIGEIGFPVALNPLFSASRLEMEINSALWAAPVVFDQHFHAQPDQLTEVPLPENGDVTDDGKTVTMHLRHNLHWSDGQPLLASDFAYWWHLNQNPDTGAITTSGYDRIVSLDTPDDFTVVLHFKQAFGPYLNYLPYAAPEHSWGKLAPVDLQNHPEIFQAPTVSDGPYKLAAFNPHQSYTLIPDTFYTSTTFHGPFLAHLLYRGYTDLTDLTAAVRSGQVDMVEGYTENDLTRLTNLPSSLQLNITSSAAYEHLDFNLSHPLLQATQVRQALQLALDRCGILRDLLHTADCTRLANQVEVPPSLYHDPTIQTPAFDPAQARQLLNSAGWSLHPDGWLYKEDQRFSLDLVTTSDNPLRAAVAERIQQNLRAVGIDVQLHFYDLAQFFGLYNRGGILATGAYDLAIFGYANSPEPDDEYNVFVSSQIPDSTHPDLGNYGRIVDPIIDQALNLGRSATAFNQRLQAYHTFLERLASQVYLIPLFSEINLIVMPAGLRNASGNPDSIANNWNIADWWLAS